MKYFNIIDCIHKKREYGVHKQFVKEMLGGSSTQTSAMDLVEKLNKSLKTRYQYLNDKSIKKDMLVDNNSNSILSTDIPEPYIESISLITCQELFALIQDKSSSILIMDCRPKKDFQESHLHCQWCVSVPEEYITDG